MPTALMIIVWIIAFLLNGALFLFGLLRVIDRGHADEIDFSKARIKNYVWQITNTPEDGVVEDIADLANGKTRITYFGAEEVLKKGSRSEREIKRYTIYVDRAYLNVVPKTSKLAEAKVIITPKHPDDYEKGLLLSGMQDALTKESFLRRFEQTTSRATHGLLQAHEHLMKEYEYGEMSERVLQQVKKLRQQSVVPVDQLGTLRKVEP
jgi:hypothetical protein